MSDPEGNIGVEDKSHPGAVSRFRRYARVVAHHTVKHTGVGIVCAVAYFDP